MKCRASFVKELSASLHPAPFQEKVTAQVRPGGRQSVGRSPTPSNPQTEAQWYQRRHYRDCFVGWQGSTEQEKADWKDQADSENVTNYVAYMRACLLDMANKRYWWRLTMMHNPYACYGDNWVAMTWKNGILFQDEVHITHNWNLYFGRVGNPPSLVYSIREADAEHKPTGSDLVRGQIDCDDFLEDPAYDSQNLPLTGCLIRKPKEYSVVMRVPSGDASNYVKWYDGGISPGMAQDYVLVSSDKGNTWAVQFMKWNAGSEWGVPYPYPP